MIQTAWDLRPLTEPLTRTQVRAWRRAHRHVRSGEASPAWTLLIAVPMLGFALFYLGFAVPSILGRSTRFELSGLVTIALPILMLGAVVAVVSGAFRGAFGRTERLMRLYTFAQANGFGYSPRGASPGYPGMVFQIGRDRTAVDRIARADGRFLDIGNLRYTTGSGKNRKVRTWGYMALRLDRRLPHMLLDARANNGLLTSNLPTTFAKNQVLSLEGDFDRHFTLYCPREYERDALYVFTPDLMALLIDEAGAFDIEVIDDWMLVYSTTAFRMGDPATLLRLARIVDTVGAKTVRQTRNYADERVGDRAANIVAPPGARLRRGVPWATLAIIAAMIAVWVAFIQLR